MPAKTHVRSLIHLLSCMAIIGGVVSGSEGALIAAGLVVVVGGLVLIATPVVGFTRNQMALTSKGREIATSVEDVRILKECDARAFMQPFAAILRGLSARDISSAEHGRERAGDVPVANRRADRRAKPSFWQSLTATERRALTARAQHRTFAPGTILCRQDEPAESVIVIESGWTRVYTQDGGGPRLIAERGPGGLIGERAAFSVRSRSATVITVGTVHALVITTQDFAIFINEHPRVLTVLEQQVYDRLTEDRTQWAPPSPALTGQICSIFLTDITAFGSSSRNDDDRRAVRRAMYTILEGAFQKSNGSWLACHREDRGDGVLIVMPPTTPADFVVGSLLPCLTAALRTHNRQASDAVRIQLRAALHVGPVVRDAEGVSGQAIIHAARLLDAPPLKRQLTRTVADLGFMASTFVFDAVIRHSVGDMNPASYRKVQFHSKESTITAWMHLAGGRGYGEPAGPGI